MDASQTDSEIKVMVMVGDMCEEEECHIATR